MAREASVGYSWTIVVAIISARAPGHLDAGRAAADDDEVDGALVDRFWVPVGLLEGLDDPRRQAFRIVERVERERCSAPGVSKKFGWEPAARTR